MTTSSSPDHLLGSADIISWLEDSAGSDDENIPQSASYLTVGLLDELDQQERQRNGHGMSSSSPHQPLETGCTSRSLPRTSEPSLEMRGSASVPLVAAPPKDRVKKKVSSHSKKTKEIGSKSQPSISNLMTSSRTLADPKSTPSSSKGEKRRHKSHRTKEVVSDLPSSASVPSTNTQHIISPSVASSHPYSNTETLRLIPTGESSLTELSRHFFGGSSFFSHGQSDLLSSPSPSSLASLAGEDLQHGEESPVIFVNPLASSLICPIHKDIMSDPVVSIVCGHSFCRDCIIKHLGPDPCCPLDQKPIQSPGQLVPNIALSDHINDQLVYCRYALKKKNGRWVLDRQGCPEQLKLGSRSQHELECNFAFCRCPQCPDLPPFRKLALIEHLQTCNRTRCPNSEFGCNFLGSKEELDHQHMSCCDYEKIKGFIQLQNSHSQAAKAQISSLQQENTLLKHALVELCGRFDKALFLIEKRFTILEQSIPYLPINSQEKESSPPFLQDEKLQLTCQATLKGHSGPVWALAFSNNILISGSSDSTIKVWDTTRLSNSQTPIATLTGHTGIVHAVGLNTIKGRQHVISGSSDKIIKVWDLKTSKCIKTLRQHENTVCSIVVASGYIFSGSFGEIKVWNPSTYEEVRTLSGHNHWVRAIAIQDNTLYSGSYNLISIWDLKTFERKQTLELQCGSIYSIAVGEKYLLAGTFENLIYRINLESKERESLHSHQGAVYSLCIVGNRLLSGSYDNTIRFWDIEKNRCLATVGKHNSSVEALVLGNRALFSGSSDATIKWWS